MAISFFGGVEFDPFFFFISVCGEQTESGLYHSGKEKCLLPR